MSDDALWEVATKMVLDKEFGLTRGTEVRHNIYDKKAELLQGIYDAAGPWPPLGPRRDA